MKYRKKGRAKKSPTESVKIVRLVRYQQCMMGRTYGGSRWVIAWSGRMEDRCVMTAAILCQRQSRSCLDIKSVKTRRSSTANRRSLCLHWRTFLWPWPLNPSPWKPNRFLNFLFRLWYLGKFCSDPFSDSAANKFTRFPRPSLPDHNRWPDLTWLRDLETLFSNAYSCIKFDWFEIHSLSTVEQCCQK